METIKNPTTETTTETTAEKVTAVEMLQPVFELSYGVTPETMCELGLVTMATAAYSMAPKGLGGWLLKTGASLVITAAGSHLGCKVWDHFHK